MVSVVWFSLEDWHNALWAFQLGWYLSLFCLIAMLYLLLIPEHRKLAFAFAVTASVAASVSNVQGLPLWPVGLICLLWIQSVSPRLWSRGTKIKVLVWLGATIGTVGAYMSGYTFQPACSVKKVFIYDCTSESSGFALHHPVKTAGVPLRRDWGGSSKF